MPASERGRGREVAALLLLFAFLAGLRLLLLDADPPGSVQRHFVTDEGWWAHNARLHYLFGAWSLDEHDVALVWAPLFTGALRLVFGALGEGLVPLRLLSVASGLATCLLVFGCVRVWHGPRAAFLATGLLGTHFFTLTHHRIGFPETFQALFVTATLLSAVATTRRPAWALATGLAFAGALAAKVSALWVALPLAAFWLLHLRGPPASGWRAPLLFAASVAAAAGVVGLFLVLPNVELFEASLQRRITMSAGGNPLSGLAQLGLHHDFPVGEIRASGFVRQSPLLLGCTALLLLESVRRGRLRRAPPLETMAWCWLLLGLLAIGTEVLAPDRRFLALAPALCILVALALDGAGIALPARPAGERAYTKRALGIALFAGVLLGLGLRGGLAEGIRAAAGASRDAASLAAWMGFAAGGAALLPPLLRRLPARRVVLPGAAVLAAFLALNLAPFALSLASPRYSMRDASSALARRTEGWPAERAIVGDAADTLALGTGQFAFLIRRWEERGMYLNLDGWERFDPWLALGDAPPRAGFERLDDLKLAAGSDGAPRFTIPVYLRRAPQAP